MSELSPGRRTVLAVSAVAIAAYLLRPQLADALVVRGDEQLYRGRPARALPYYRRAVALSPFDRNAVDRFLFAALIARDGGAIDEGIRLSSTYLRAREDDGVRWDRAMAYRVRGSLAEALADFTRVGLHDRNAAALTFAGFAAARLGARGRAITLWRAAVALEPSLPTPRRALERAETSR